MPANSRWNLIERLKC